jgi:hypothetical protein
MFSFSAPSTAMPQFGGGFAQGSGGFHFVAYCFHFQTEGQQQTISANEGIIRLLTPALSSFGEERGNYFWGKNTQGCVRWRGLTPGYYHLPPAGLQFGFASIREIRVNSSVPLQFLLAAIGGSPGVSPHRICVDPRSSAGHKPVVNTTRKRALPLIMRS